MIDKAQKQAQNEAFGVYIHWPFCAAKCPYCDFNSHVRPGGVDQKTYADAIVKELETLRRHSGSRVVSSVFFGGGTPSLMKPQITAQILQAIAKFWHMDESVEITLEANPNSLETQNFAGYKDAGVNRISIGVQSLKYDDLKFLGRLHNKDEAIRAVKAAAQYFDRVSFDLIYSLPDQSLALWRTQLLEALKLPAEHLSLYQLTIEPQTPFAALHKRGKLTLPREKLARELYDITRETCAKAGFAQYEISNYAKPGAQSRHNLLYWRHQDYAGAGPGAHSRIRKNGEKYAFETEKHPETWKDLVTSQGHGFTKEDQLSGRDTGIEILLMGLRLAEGVDLENYSAASGKSLNQETLKDLQQRGLITEISPGKIAATNEGSAVLDAIIVKLAD